MIIRVDMIITHMVIIVLKVIFDIEPTLWCGYDDHAWQRHDDHDEYSSTGESSTSSAEYRGFEYYHYGTDIVQLSYYSDAGFSCQSSQLTGSP